jgi:peptidoglycan L-alanyl-D-glutamate endopeptidase CwlK
MFYFGKNSRNRLLECHPDLQELFNEVIRYQNCAVLVGRRGQHEQNQAFLEGRSRLIYPKSKHNREPSLAADVVPWHKNRPHIRWDDRERFYHFAGFVLGIAAKKKINVRWGGDWDQDGELRDQTFFDLPHFELIEE